MPFSMHHRFFRCLLGFVGPHVQLLLSPRGSHASAARLFSFLQIEPPPPRPAPVLHATARTSPLPVHTVAGEAHRHRLHPMRASPGRSGPASAVPPCATPSPRTSRARVTRHARRGRVHAAPRSPWARSRLGQGHPAALTWPGGAADPWGPPVSAWAGPAGCI